MTAPSPEFPIYVAGLLTPFLVLAAFAAIDSARERIRKRVHAPKGIFIGATAYCPVRSCNYSCTSFLEGRRRQRKSILKFMAEHKAEEHSVDGVPA